MNVEINVLTVGAEETSELIAGAIGESSSPARHVLAEDADAIREALENDGPWHLIACDAVHLELTGLNELLGEHDTGPDTSLIILNSDEYRMTHEEALDYGADDVVDAQNRHHVLMAIGRELKNAMARRPLDKPQAETGAPESTPAPATEAPQAETDSPEPAPAPATEAPQAEIESPEPAPAPTTEAPQAVNAKPVPGVDQSLLDAIGNAIEREEVALMFQPIVDLGAPLEDVELYQVLARLRDAQGELIYPKDFIHVAEQAGLMPAIDRIVVKKIVDILKQMPRPENYRFFINLSGHSLCDDLMAAYIQDTITSSGIPSGSVAFELSKKNALRSLEHTRLFTKHLEKTDLGFLLKFYHDRDLNREIVDSVGIQYLKLSQTMLEHIARDTARENEARRIIQRLKKTGVRVIAHTVDHVSLMPFLYRMGVDYVQGNVVSAVDNKLTYPAFDTVQVNECASF